MLDLKLIRTEPETARKGLKDRGGRYLPALEEVLRLDEKRRAALREAEVLLGDRKTLSKKIEGLIRERKIDMKAVKASGKDMTTAVAEGGYLGPEDSARLREIGERLPEAEKAAKELDAQVEQLLLGLPNLPHATSPIGASEADNPVVEEHAEKKRALDFPPKDHQALGEALGILDVETAGRLSGARFAILKGAGARLERALGQFLLDLATRERGYQEAATPYLVTAETLTGTGQLPKFEEDQYKTAPDGLYLVPTAEVTLTNLHRGETIDEKRLPLKYAALTACFRREAGSYGKDTRGLIRQHQFNKVELVWLTRPEDSMDALKRLVEDASECLRRLEIPYRVIELCTADIGFSSAKTFDIEVWMPGENRWREISSCSNCLDFQARRIGTRVRRPDGKTEPVHTLNGSGVAVGRLFAAVMENYQRKDGSIEIPTALRPHFGADAITAEGRKS